VPLDTSIVTASEKGKPRGRKHPKRKEERKKKEGRKNIVKEKRGGGIQGVRDG
jgi:hypothetical protein